MTMISYAQNGEDVRLARAFPSDRPGFYIDVGASYPDFDSVTKHLYDHGWQGINIEPGRHVFAAPAAGRPRDINLEIGLSDHEGELVFHEAVTSLGMSSFDPDFVGGLKRDGFPVEARSVRVTTLAKICAEHVGDRTIDLLKIDVEAHETEVIRGADWTRWRPRCLVVEATRPERWEPILLGAGYRFIVFDGLNRFYVRSEDTALASKLITPPNVLDNFELHRYIVARDELRRQFEAERAELVRQCDDLRAERDAARAARDQAQSAVEQLEARLNQFTAYGPNALAVARAAQHLAQRYPRLAGAVKRMARRAG